MKHIFILTLSLCLIFSCSSETNSNEELNNPTIQFSNFIIKSYDAQNGNPETVVDSINYVLMNNKIISAEGIRFSNNLEKSYDYTYTNNKLSEIAEFRDGVLDKKELFIYDDENELIEYIEEFVTNPTESSFTKYEFQHTNDTIYSTQSFSDDGINFDSNILSKHVLDVNDNCTYYSGRFPSDTNDRFIESFNYDADKNLIMETVTNFSSNGTENTNTNQNVPDSSINPYYIINTETFSKKVLMLLYPFKNNSVNLINPSRISPNSTEAFITTFGGVEFIINSTIDSDNIATYNEFQTFSNGNYFSRQTREFLIQ